jgi:Ca2+/H+ antiporter
MSTDTQSEGTENIDHPALARYKVHLEHRKMLHDAYLEVTGRYSRAILTLSGGALALSMTYVEKLQTNLSGHGKGFLIASWITLGSSLAMALLALYLSGRATQTAIENNDKEYVSREKTPDVATAAIHNGFSAWTQHFSWIALLLFLIGIILISIFVGISPPTPHPNSHG